MSKLDDIALNAAQGTIEALQKRLPVCEIEGARIKQEWIEMYRLYAGQKWSDPTPSYEEALKEWERRHDL